VESSALVTVSLISVWQFVGIPMILIYTALLAIPDEIVEAAQVEGASPWRIFWSIRLPLILPTLGLVNILTFVGNFNAFDLVYAVKGALAGPNYSTDLLGTLFYRTFFGYQSQVGSATMGAALATLMFLVILAGVGVYFFFVQRRLQRFAA
jgi:raffinose/stachyose/melibiose transport system permease protein